MFHHVELKTPRIGATSDYAYRTVAADASDSENYLVLAVDRVLPDLVNGSAHHRISRLPKAIERRWSPPRRDFGGSGLARVESRWP